MLTEIVINQVNGAGWLPVLAALLAIAGAFLAAWWAWTWPGLVLTWLGVLITIVGERDPIGASSVVIFIVFALTAKGLRPVRVAGISAFVLAVIFGVASIVSSGEAVKIDAVAVIVGVVAAGAIGSAVYLRGRYWESLEQRTQDAIATREAEAERRVSEERVRIARDFHDIVGHHVAVVSMHLGALEVTQGRDPESAARSLAAAREAVQAVLTETQRTLSILRSAEEINPEDDRTPTPGMQTLPELLRSFREIGLKVDHQIDADAVEVTPTLGVTIYRIVQEGLTNAHRYGTGEAALTILTEPGTLTISVANPVATGQVTIQGSGFGLTGMRERVDSTGGHLVTSDSDGVFTLAVRLPLRESSKS